MRAVFCSLYLGLFSHVLVVSTHSTRGVFFVKQGLRALAWG